MVGRTEVTFGPEVAHGPPVEWSWTKPLIIEYNCGCSCNPFTVLNLSGYYINLSLLCFFNPVRKRIKISKSEFFILSNVIETRMEKEPKSPKINLLSMQRFLFLRFSRFSLNTSSLLVKPVFFCF